MLAGESNIGDNDPTLVRNRRQRTVHSFDIPIINHIQRQCEVSESCVNGLTHGSCMWENTIAANCACVNIVNATVERVIRVCLERGPPPPDIHSYDMETQERKDQPRQRLFSEDTFIDASNDEQRRKRDTGKTFADILKETKVKKLVKASHSLTNGGRTYSDQNESNNSSRDISTDARNTIQNALRIRERESTSSHHTERNIWAAEKSDPVKYISPNPNLPPKGTYKAMPAPLSDEDKSPPISSLVANIENLSTNAGGIEGSSSQQFENKAQMKLSFDLAGLQKLISEQNLVVSSDIPTQDGAVNQFDETDDAELKSPTTVENEINSILDSSNNEAQLDVLKYAWNNSNAHLDLLLSMEPQSNHTTMETMSESNTELGDINHQDLNHLSSLEASNSTALPPNSNLTVLPEVMSQGYGHQTIAAGSPQSLLQPHTGLSSQLPHSMQSEPNSPKQPTHLHPLQPQDHPQIIPNPISQRNFQHTSNQPVQFEQRRMLQMKAQHIRMQQMQMQKGPQSNNPQLQTLQSRILSANLSEMQLQQTQLYPFQLQQSQIQQPQMHQSIIQPPQRSQHQKQISQTLQHQMQYAQMQQTPVQQPLMQHQFQRVQQHRVPPPQTQLAQMQQGIMQQSLKQLPVIPQMQQRHTHQMQQLSMQQLPQIAPLQVQSRKSYSQHSSNVNQMQDSRLHPMQTNNPNPLQLSRELQLYQPLRPSLPSPQSSYNLASALASALQGASSYQAHSRSPVVNFPTSATHLKTNQEGSFHINRINTPTGSQINNNFDTQNNTNTHQSQTPLAIAPYPHKKTFSTRENNVVSSPQANQDGAANQNPIDPINTSLNSSFTHDGAFASLAASGAKKYPKEHRYGHSNRDGFRKMVTVKCAKFLNRSRKSNPKQQNSQQGQDKHVVDESSSDKEE